MKKYTDIKRVAALLHKESLMPSYDIEHEYRDDFDFPWYICVDFVRDAFKVTSDYISVTLSTSPIKGGIAITQQNKQNEFSTPLGVKSVWSALYRDIRSLDSDTFYILVETLDKETYDHAK